MKSEDIVSAYKQFRQRLLTDISSQGGKVVVAFVARDIDTDIRTIAQDFARTCSASKSSNVLFVSDGMTREHPTDEPDIVVDHDYLGDEQASNVLSNSVDSPLSAKPGRTIEARMTIRDISQDPRWVSARARLIEPFDTVVIGAGCLDDDAASSWKPLITRTILVIDSMTTSLAELERLGVEARSGRTALDGAILSQMKYYIPDWVYRRFW
jgi:hypothetical protein